MSDRSLAILALIALVVAIVLLSNFWWFSTFN